METMHHLKEMLEDELDKVVDKGVVSRDALDVIDKLTHSIKSIDTIIAMEDAGYSYGDYSDARGRGRNAKRDSMGRYSRGRYSYDDDSMSTLEHMMSNATDPHEREMIQKMMEHYR